eukprot:771751-Rhodomonas_salina.2
MQVARLHPPRGHHTGEDRPPQVLRAQAAAAASRACECRARSGVLEREGAAGFRGGEAGRVEVERRRCRPSNPTPSSTARPRLNLCRLRLRAKSGHSRSRTLSSTSMHPTTRTTARVGSPNKSKPPTKSQPSQMSAAATWAGSARRRLVCRMTASGEFAASPSRSNSNKMPRMASADAALSWPCASASYGSPPRERSDETWRTACGAACGPSRACRGTDSSSASSKWSRS